MPPSFRVQNEDLPLSHAGTAFKAAWRIRFLSYNPEGTPLLWQHQGPTRPSQPHFGSTASAAPVPPRCLSIPAVLTFQRSQIPRELRRGEDALIIRLLPCRRQLDWPCINRLHRGFGLADSSEGSASRRRGQPSLLSRGDRRSPAPSATSSSQAPTEPQRHG